MMNSDRIKKNDHRKILFGGVLEGDDASAGAMPEAVLSRIAKALPYTLETQTPPTDLKLKILSAVREHEKNVNVIQQEANGEKSYSGNSEPPIQLWKNWSPAFAVADLIVQRNEEGVWEKTGVAGVEVKRLFVDHKRDYVTMLVRMQPGSSYPSHRHGGFEECYVLQGDLAVGDTVLMPGDYQRAEGGSVHLIQSTQNGCLLFIVSSQYDELLT